MSNPTNIEQPTKEDRRKRNGPQSRPISVVLSAEILQEMDNIAVEKNWTRGGLIRIAIMEFLDRQERRE